MNMKSQYIRKKGFRLPAMIILTVFLSLGGLNFVFGTGHISVALALESDINADGVVDLTDLIIFSEEHLKQDLRTVDWCEWILTPYKNKQHLEELIAFIEEEYNCGGGSNETPLAVKNDLVFPARLALDISGKLYVSDPKVGSVFIYDSYSPLDMIGELKGLGRPLGVAVDDLGNIYVGSSTNHNVQVFTPDGYGLSIIGDGILTMPNDLAFDAAGNLYVVDSRASAVFLFNPSTGELLSSIGQGELKFPVSIALGTDELFVADQGNNRIKVFDLVGNLLRSYSTEVGGYWGYTWKGRSIQIQSLAIDPSGRLLMLDSNIKIIQALDAVTGAFLASYPVDVKKRVFNPFRLPLDIQITGTGQMIVADGLVQSIILAPIP